MPSFYQDCFGTNGRRESTQKRNALSYSPLVDVAALRLSECSVHRWSDHGSCVMRALAVGELPRGACAFEAAAEAAGAEN